MTPSPHSLITSNMPKTGVSVLTVNDRIRDIRVSEEMNKKRNIVLSFETITDLTDTMRKLSKVLPFETFI